MKKKIKLMSFREWQKEKFKDPEFRRYAQQVDDDPFVATALQIIRTRREKHLTQTQLARRAKTSQEAISRMESLDYRGYSLSVLEKVADALGKKVHITLT